MTSSWAILEALAGRYVTYIGGLCPDLLAAIWDPGEQVWAVRLREADVPYSCGVECCGIQTYAVVAVEPSTLATTTAS